MRILYCGAVCMHGSVCVRDFDMCVVNVRIWVCVGYVILEF